jgi:hypothetical protein
VIGEQHGHFRRLELLGHKVTLAAKDSETTPDLASATQPG